MNLRNTVCPWLAAAVLWPALPAAAQPAPVRAWFTQAEVPGSVASQAPSGSLPAVPGCVGRGVRLDGSVAMPVPGLQRSAGMLGFWVRPRWNGADGRSHTLLRIGDPARNGLLIEKSAQGMLRFVMASPQKRTASRADVSHWRPGEWHHVVCAWFSREGRPLGLPMWIDRVAVDGPVAGGNTFMDPAAMQDARLWVGSPGAEADMDELVIRHNLEAEGRTGHIGTVYRDYFRTAPYSAVRIDREPLRVPSDRRAVAGLTKQYGLEARRSDSRAWEPVTDYVVRYGQWADFDAKPMIRWTVDDTAVAAVDGSGRLTGARPGRTTLTAAFRGMRGALPVTVISPERPDAGLICVELLPRYRNDAAKDRPAPGDRVTARVRLGSFGLRPLPAGTGVRLELVRLGAHPYRFSASAPAPVRMESQTGRDLAPGEETAVEFAFTYPAQPLWMRVRLDPAGAVDEICEANNEEAERTDARPVQMGYAPAVLKACLAERKVNHVGSLSYYDWLRAQVRRMDVMLREAVWPTTGPHGVEDAYRIDAMTPLAGGEWEHETYAKQEGYFDGGFPVNEPVDLMAVDSAIIHEFGHTMLSQPDLYGYPQRASNVLLTDPQGKLYAGTDLLPVVAAGETLSFSHALNVPCGGAYTSLMDYCHLWLHASQAGHVMHYRGYRQDRFWGTQGRLIPTRRNALLLYDLEDRPLAGAAVYVYHVVQAPVQDSGAKYIPDRPKFMGNADADGRWVLPGSTDPDWDDAATDDFDGEVSVWNPFGRVLKDTAFTPNVWEVEGLLLLKIVSGTQTEFRWMDLTEFNEAYLSGSVVSADYAIRTSLVSSAGVTPLERRPVPAAVRKTNLAPVAVAPREMTVTCGQEFEIDGSASHDPEGQPLIYRWNVNGSWLRTDIPQGPKMRMKAPDKPGVVEYRFWVIDGLRCSEPATVRVRAEAAK